ncbi:MAG TPA: hypothetical protein VLY24_12385 [Bryobacteraceae bacterium]|nr:hypothetical protein [Bryobacteraceae bacterium]
MDQVIQVGRTKAKAVAGHVGDEFCTRFVTWIVELAAARILAEMGGIGIVQKRTLVVVEPPGKPRVAGVFEIDDSVFIAIKERRVERLRRFVGHAGIAELRAGVHGTVNEAAEESSRRCPIKTMVVVQDAFQHQQYAENLSACLNAKKKATGGDILFWRLLRGELRGYCQRVESASQAAAGCKTVRSILCYI